VKKALCVIQKRYWFYDNAAPIPGVSFVKKRKALYKKENMSYKNFLAMFSKKQMKALLTKASGGYGILAFENLPQSIFSKGFMATNAVKTRFVLAATQSSAEHTTGAA
jgi:hypothetical protein